MIQQDAWQLSFTEKVKALPEGIWKSDLVYIKQIEDENDLWYAVAECALTPEQEEYVNPAGFSIGRAYLKPQDNVPCVICKPDGQRIGFILLDRWLGEGEGVSWSYYIDTRFQGRGYGKAAAELAIKILRAADPQTPIKLSTEQANSRAQKLYRSIGFVKSEEMDGDDWVFVYQGP